MPRSGVGVSRIEVAGNFEREGPRIAPAEVVVSPRRTGAVSMAGEARLFYVEHGGGVDGVG